MSKKLKEYKYSKEELAKFKIAKIEVKDRGDIYLELFYEDVANTVSNFASLAQDGFYDNLSFHRVIDGFMAQGGCPRGDGTGSPDFNIACETNSKKQVHNKGSLSMAHAGPNTGGSQFFICFCACPHLDGVHTVFGAINENDKKSFEVLDSIKQDDKITTIKILSSKK